MANYKTSVAHVSTEGYSTWVTTHCTPS